MRHFVFILIFIACSLSGVHAAQPNISGPWEANVMGSAIKAQIQQNGSQISGVAYIYNPFGKRDTYHFSGTVENGRVSAKHHSGHHFVGNLTPQGWIAGTLRTQGGQKFDLTARRP